MGLNFYFLKKNSFLIFLFVVFSYSLQAQNSSNRSTYIKDKLQKIDSLIEVKEYDRAEKLIANTKNTFSFRSNSEEKLAFDYRSVQILYDKNKEEDALKILLAGFEKLKTIIREGRGEGANTYAEKFDWYKANQKKVIKDWDMPDYNW